jgi:hypothetical protein
LLNTGLFPTSLPSGYYVLLAADTKIDLRKNMEYVQKPEGTAQSCLLSYRQILIKLCEAVVDIVDVARRAAPEEVTRSS